IDLVFDGDFLVLSGGDRRRKNASGGDERRRLHAHLYPCFARGNVRTRWPVAVKIAFAIAGRIGGSAGSPRPVGLLSVVRKCTLISFGAWRIRSGSYSANEVSTAWPSLIVISYDISWLMPSMIELCTCASELSGLMICLPMSAATQTLFTRTR